MPLNPKAETFRVRVAVKEPESRYGGMYLDPAIVGRITAFVIFSRV